MSNQTNLLNDLDHAKKIRKQFAELLENLLNELYLIKRDKGMLFDREAETISNVKIKLDEGRFRILVLGDMKRGKSTFLNAILGENILPRDVNRSTAILTIVRHGYEKLAEIHFKDARSPQKITIEEFKATYTLEEKETTEFESKKQDAFPDVAYAIIEYPLDILEKGVEIIDSPGLNDNEYLNQLTLSYVSKSDTILFILSAIQQFTQDEKRYLNNNIKNRNLTVFYIANRWDSITQSCLPDEVCTAELKVKNGFKKLLSNYCIEKGKNNFDKRFFGVSSLNALTNRLANKPLDGTGFPAFLDNLEDFLTRDRLDAELRSIKGLVLNNYNNVKERTGLQKSLVKKSIEELERSILEIQPEFDKLNNLKEKQRKDIKSVAKTYALEIKDSFKTYMLTLDQTFEKDFESYAPQVIGLFKFLKKNEREKFKEEFKSCFQEYLEDKVSYWLNNDVQQKLKQANEELEKLSNDFENQSQNVLEQVQIKIDPNNNLIIRTETENETNRGSRIFGCALAILNCDVAAAIGAGTGVINLGQTLVNVLAVSLAWLAFGPLGLLVGPLLSLNQANNSIKELTAKLKEELKQQMPVIVNSESETIHRRVLEQFESYETKLMEAIDADISERKQELNNLLERKRKQNIKIEEEIKYFDEFDKKVYTIWHKMEDTYNNSQNISCIEV